MLTLRLFWNRLKERVPQQISRWLPRKIVMQCAIRVGAHATVGKYGSTNVTELLFMDALNRWDDKNDSTK
jgi:hypothetical protein